MVLSKNELRYIELINWAQQSLLAWLGVGLASLIGLIEFVHKIGESDLIIKILYECLLFLLIGSLIRIIDHLDDVFKWKIELEKIGWVFPKPEKRYSTKIMDKILKKLTKDSRVAILVYSIPMILFEAPLIRENIINKIFHGFMHTIENVNFSIIPIIGNKLNVGQELFLILFSILYGVMLQGLPAFLFPLGRALRGYRNRKGEVESDPYWMKVWKKRSGLSIFVFNFLPAIYLWFMLTFLSCIPFPLYHIWQLLYIIGIFWSSLGVYGFYRIYYIFVVKYWETYFIDMIKVFDDRGLTYDVIAHVCWMVYYLIPGPLILGIIYAYGI